MDDLIISTQRTNLTQHELWRHAVIMPWHTDHGTMGFVMNQPVANLTHESITSSYDVGRVPRTRIFCGGPQHTERCTVLHSRDWSHQDSRIINDQCAITFNRDVITACREGKGPRHYKVMLGWCQWEDGQLDAEMMRGVWHATPWHNTAWSSYKSSSKMWRRIIESEAAVTASSFMNSLDSPT